MSKPRLLLAAEDMGHHEAVVRLTDRILEADVEWLRGADVVESCREWLESPYLPLKDAYRRASDARLKVWGHFDGKPAEPEAAMWRAVLLLANALPERPDVVVLARDEDNRPERQLGLKQAVEANAWAFAIITALAVTEIEAWLVAGFEPADEHERAALERFMKEEGFDPRHESHRLVGQTARDAKKLLRTLTKDEVARRSACLESDLAVLKERGASNGLHDFIEAVRAVVVPKFVRG
jgi:hypothetical protein